ILRPLPAGILLASRTAVRTDKLDPVLLRIAVQSSPSGAAHANCFWVTPFHRVSSLVQIHVHKTCDALYWKFDTAPLSTSSSVTYMKPSHCRPTTSAFGTHLIRVFARLPNPDQSKNLLRSLIPGFRMKRIQPFQHYSSTTATKHRVTATKHKSD